MSSPSISCCCFEMHARTCKTLWTMQRCSLPPFLKFLRSLVEPDFRTSCCYLPEAAYIIIHNCPPDLILYKRLHPSWYTSIKSTARYLRFFKLLRWVLVIHSQTLHRGLRINAAACLQPTASHPISRIVHAKNFQINCSQRSSSGLHVAALHLFPSLSECCCTRYIRCYQCFACLLPDLEDRQGITFLLILFFRSIQSTWLNTGAHCPYHFANSGAYAGPEEAYVVPNLLVTNWET